MINTVLRSAKKLEIFSGQLFKTFPKFNSKLNILATADYIGSHTRFATATRTDAGTTTLVTPITGGSIIITDMIISGEKQVASTTEVRFTDGTNNESLFLASAVDTPPNVNHTFRGRVQGWVDARIDFITSGTADSTLTLVFVKVPTGLTYAEWDGLR